MLHDAVIRVYAAVMASVQTDGVKEKTVGFLKGTALKGLVFAHAHPVYTGIAAGVVGMVIVFALRKALKKTLQWSLWEVPTTVLGVVFKPIRAAYRKVRGRSPMGLRQSRIPMIGETAYVGPCRGCGTKREYQVKVSGYSGGALRGVDTVSGAQVLSCADCTKA